MSPAQSASRSHALGPALLASGLLGYLFTWLPQCPAARLPGSLVCPLPPLPQRRFLSGASSAALPQRRFLSGASSAALPQRRFLSGASSAALPQRRLPALPTPASPAAGPSPSLPPARPCFGVRSLASQLLLPSVKLLTCLLACLPAYLPACVPACLPCCLLSPGCTSSSYRSGSAGTHTLGLEAGG